MYSFKFPVGLDWTECSAHKSVAVQAAGSSSGDKYANIFFFPQWPRFLGFLQCFLRRFLR